MSKAAIKNFAIWARKKLIADIEYKAGLIGISEAGIKDALPQSTKDVEFYDIGTKDPYALSSNAIKQRRSLVELIRQKEKTSDHKTAYRSVVEEVAYTWFNRLIAIRFMEVNDYLPSHIRVLSSESERKTVPDLVTTPFDADLDFSQSEREEVLRFKQENRVDDLFRMVFIKQCNALNEILPHLFEKTEDYSELLLNISATDQNSVVYHLVHDIAEDDFNVEKEGQVEIIGWLYQFYNTEPKANVFGRASGAKIKKEEVPAATQLFTPDWIVRYMVENSLGRFWIDHLKGNYEKFLNDGGIDESGEGVGDIVESFLNEWKYYVLEAEQTDEVEEALKENRKDIAQIFPQEIKFIDPCMGSGHILVYAFDVFVQIYTSKGYSEKEAVREIIENNLFGIEIDDRAYQLSYFALMMKGRQYDRRFLTRSFEPHLCAIQESNGFNKDYLELFERDQETAEKIVDLFKDAKEYGSILNVDIPMEKLATLNIEMQRIEGREYDNIIDSIRQMGLMSDFAPLLKQAMLMAQKYEVVVTNPPYMGSSGMSPKLSNFVKMYYPDTKSDISTVFMEKNLKISNSTGYVAMINIPVWMFLSSYEKLRESLISKNTIINMIHFGRGIFGSDFGTTSFVIQSKIVKNYLGSYRRLFDKQGAVDSVETKEKWFFAGKGRFTAQQENYSKIPGSPIAYWVNENVRHTFDKVKLKEIIHPKQGTSTGDDETYVRFWSEIDYTKFSFSQPTLKQALNSGYDYFPLNKGGEYKKWYGNNEKVILMNMYAYEKLLLLGNHLPSRDFYFKEGITWSKITSSSCSFRWNSYGFVFSSVGLKGFPPIQINNYTLGFLNSKLTDFYLKIISPGLSTVSGDIEKLPLIINEAQKLEIDRFVGENLIISKSDWDSFEASWDFIRHPLVANRVKDGWGDDGPASGRISQSYKMWQEIVENNFLQLKANEEELNRIFIDIYGLQDELTPEVAEKDVTVARIYDSKVDIPESMKGNSYVLTKADVVKSLISYAVGCMFGRYSLDAEGLAYAGGEWDDSKYATYLPDADNILPVTDEEYFEDDIVGLFCAWVKKVYGAETLEENFDFIAQALGNTGSTSREIIRNYFLKDFFKDHCKIYKKRPIYWLFDSGKQNGFKALIYMHRYDADTIGNLRVDYLHRMESVYESEIVRMQNIIDSNASAREITAATKRKEKLQKQLKECKEYDEMIAHLALGRISIDLDDGVKVNYEKVQTGTDGKQYPVLAKI